MRGNAMGLTGERENRVRLAAWHRRTRSLGTSDRLCPLGIHRAGTTSRPGAQMNPPAEDGGGPPTALAQDHAQDHGEQPVAVSVPQRRAPTDGFAVASLISGILALIPLAVIFGPVALGRIVRTGARGRALAITGLVLGGTWAGAAAGAGARGARPARPGRGGGGGGGGAAGVARPRPHPPPPASQAGRLAQGFQPAH